MALVPAYHVHQPSTFRFNQVRDVLMEREPRKGMGSTLVYFRNSKCHIKSECGLKFNFEISLWNRFLAWKSIFCQPGCFPFFRNLFKMICKTWISILCKQRLTEIFLFLLWYLAVKWIRKMIIEAWRSRFKSYLM